MDRYTLLIKGLNKGDIKAYDELFHMLYGRLTAFAMRYLKDQESAEEVVEEAMVVLWEKRELFDSIGSLKSYLYNTVRNASLDWIKSKGKNASLLELESYESLAAADAFILEEEVHAVLYQAMAALPPKCRRVFELSCLEGLKYSEIADDMGISLNTVKSQRARAIQLLQEMLKDYPYYMLILNALLTRQ